MDLRGELENMGVPLGAEQQALLDAWESKPLLPGLPPEAPGDRYQRLLSLPARSGSFFTPPDLAEQVVKQTLEPLLRFRDPSRLPTILDPACGAGWFLLQHGGWFLPG